MAENFQRNIKNLLRWVKMLSGKSYYHLPQGLGKAFKPNELSGYFNDLTGKAKWEGLLDEEGIPINQLLDGSICYFPTTIIQKALGHHDLYIQDKDNEQLNEFLKICRWLLKMQDRQGGWEVEKIMNLSGPSKYSAMPQGEAVSALVRAWKLTDDEKFLISAKKAYNIMILPVGKGGTSYYDDNDVYFEEYPATAKNTVLNGWIFSLFGVYDLFLATDNKDYELTFYKAFSTLKNILYIFDSGFWSYYDEQKALASPFYHNLHISQLEALFKTTGDDFIGQYIERWKSYQEDFLKRNYAFILKAYQKLKNPAPVVIVK